MPTQNLAPSYTVPSFEAPLPVMGPLTLEVHGVISDVVLRSGRSPPFWV